MKLGTCYKLQYNQNHTILCHVRTITSYAKYLVLAEALSNKLKQISKDRIRLSY